MFIMDPEVERVLKTALNKDEDEGITFQEAADMNLGTLFKNNTQIETFDELPYFTNPNYGTGAYQNCTNLRRVDVSNSTFPISIFEGCTNLEYFHGPNSVQGELRIKDGVTTINDRALQRTKVRSVIFPDSVRTIKNSFFECSSLQSVTFGTGPLEIKLNAFYQCTHLQEVHVPSLADWEDITFASDNNTANPLSYAHHLYVNGQEVTSITYPSGTTTLKDITFAGGSSITSVTIPSTVAFIGKDHFTGCSGLQRVDITDLDAWMDIDFSSASSNPLYYAPSLYVNGNLITSVDFTGKTEVKKLVFGWYQGLTSIVLPSTITKIGSSAFARCKNLVISDLSLPNLTSIGSYAFGTGTNGEGCKIATISNLGSITTIPEYCFANSPTLSSVTIPNTVTSIGNYVFNGCTNLALTSLPTSITTIGTYAFRNCTAMAIPDLSLPNLTTLGSYAFSGDEGKAPSITTVSNLGSITTIPEGCFNFNTSLSSVTIPNTVVTIGNMAFRGCRISSINIPSSVRTIGDRAFNGSHASTITIDEGVTTIGGYVFVTNDCTSIVFPNSLTDLGYTNLAYCNNLQTVEFGTGITNIKDQQFYGGFPSSMVSITIKATTPPTIARDTWSGVTCPIYVPAASVNTYKTTGNWTRYASLIQAIPTT